MQTGRTQDEPQNYLRMTTRTQSDPRVTMTIGKGSKRRQTEKGDFLEILFWQVSNWLHIILSLVQPKNILDTVSLNTATAGHKCMMMNPNCPLQKVI